MFVGNPSVDRGKITSTNSTRPTSQIAKQIQAQRNTRHKRPIALSRSDLVPEPVVTDAAILPNVGYD